MSLCLLFGMNGCFANPNNDKLLIKPPTDLKGGKCIKNRVYEAKAEFDKIMPGNYAFFSSESQELKQVDMYFNLQGKLIYLVEYFCDLENGNPTLKPYRTVESTYTTNSNIKLLKKIEKVDQYDDGNIVTRITNYERDSNGNLTGIFTSENDILAEKTLCKTDSRGNVTSNSVYDNSGLSYTETREYDLSDSLIFYKKEKTSYPQFEETYRFTFANNHKLNSKEYREIKNGVLSLEELRSDFVYDSYGRLISYIDKVKSADPKELFKYYTEAQKHTFKYDNYGSVTEYVCADYPSGMAHLYNIHSFEYEYNSRGEWIKKISLKHDKTPDYIITREIIYY
jgi:hypothetical protein